MHDFSDLKLAIEALSGGSNTVILDDMGMPSIVVAVPKLYLSDLLDGAPRVPHPAWLVDGMEKDVIYVSKYMNIVRDDRAYSLPAQDPRVFFTYDQAIDFCLNKGAGWHLMTNALWAAIGGRKYQQRGELLRAPRKGRSLLRLPGYGVPDRHRDRACHLVPQPQCVRYCGPHREPVGMGQRPASAER